MTQFPPFKAPNPEESDGIFICADSREHVHADNRNQLEILNRVCREKGWRAGVCAAHDASWLNYVDNPARLIFLPLLNLKATDAILEIGPGLGQMTAPIARLVSTVDVLEVVRGQAEFCSARYHQEGAGNIRITAGGDDCLLPYGDSAFDGVVLNLVIEWCGWRAAIHSHQDMHQRLLGEIARVLKPGGFLYLVTKNRYSLRLLTGGRDEHMFNMRFGSALPRQIGRLLCHHRHPPGYLHSHRELRSMLLHNRFDHIESYWATPEMRWPEQMISFEPRTFRRERRSAPQGESRRVRMIASMLPHWTIKHTAAGLVFLARTATPKPSPRSDSPIIS